MSSSSVHLSKGQDDPKLRSARLRLDRDFAIIVAHQAPHDVEAQSRAKAHRLGCEKRVENALADLRWDTGPVIDDSYHCALTIALCQYLDPAGIGTASMALSSRFDQIWLSSPAKPRTRGRPAFT